MHLEWHALSRVGWLRAAVLGANDGVISTSSLILGVAASGAGSQEIVAAGLASLCAGALSMAAGEYVSVSSQRDTELSDIAREKVELSTDPAIELEELTQIYVNRGLERPLARTVAERLTSNNALEAHLRDELGLSEVHAARPLQAAFASAGTFAVGAIIPLLTVIVIPPESRMIFTPTITILALAALGFLAAAAGRSNPITSIVRIVAWGAIAMGVTSAIGAAFGPIV